MKFFYKTWLLSVTICFSLTLRAASVDSLTVSKVATVYLSQYVDHFEGLECVVKRTSADGTPLYYVFNHKNNNGFIIVIADDACFPILGYDTTGKFSPDNVPPQLDKILFQRAAEISFIKREKFTANDETKQFWQRLKNPPATARSGKLQVAVAPLVTTTWDQSPYYNDLCPTDPKATKADGYRVVTGCVATAMAQIMKYYNYPKTGQGVYSYTDSKYGQLSANFGGTTYSWTSMPSRVTTPNLAVATLMYHCGVSINMDYDISANGGSSASTSMVADALKKYFGYSSLVRYVEKKNYATESAWITVLKAELDAKRPIQYRGSGSGGGHSFVCDGYTNDNTFHFNWGWGSQSDGYFFINALNPGSLGTGGGEGGFNSGQGAVIGIQPAVVVNSSFDLQLNKKLTVSPSSIDFGKDVTVSFNITNRGTASFLGDYAVCLFTGNGDFISFLGQLVTNSSLPAGNKYINDLTFTQKSVYLSEGSYIVAAYYREPLKEWQLLGKSTFENPIQVPVNGVTSNLKMYGTPLQTSTSPIYSNTPFSVSCNIANSGTSSFEGELSMDIYTLDGTFVAEVEIKKDILLTPNQTYSAPLVFKTTGLKLDVGTYLLVPSYRRKNETNYYVLAAYKDSKGTYPNLIQVIVAAPALVADRFEPNNSENQAVTLPLSFANNISTITTTSSNLHIGTDIDYYKLNLPTGYTYEVTARLRDSYNDKSYTADVVFTYKIGNDAYSDVYDESINDTNDKITPAAGKTLTFKIAPYFVGNKGSYLFDIQVSRKQIVLATEDDGVNEQLLVYPNPTTGPLTIKTPRPVKIHSVNVMNIMGQKVLGLDSKQVTDKLTVDISSYPAGIYYLQITGNNEPITRKISLIK